MARKDSIARDRVWRVGLLGHSGGPRYPMVLLETARETNVAMEASKPFQNIEQAFLNTLSTLLIWFWRWKQTSKDGVE